MKKFLSILLVLVMIVPVISFVGCDNGDDVKKKEEFQSIKSELDNLRSLQSEANKAIENLKQELRDLEIEKQKLIAEKKRLEAEVIDLKIKNYEDEEKRRKDSGK